MLPGILAIGLPALIQLAEGIFGSGKGKEKKELVMELLGKIWDDLAAKGKIPAWLPKDTVLGVISLVIDILAPKITAKAPA